MAVMDDDDACPGAGRCHGSLAWCDDCGDVSKICDAMFCDRHRCQECRQIRPPEEREHWMYVCDVCDPPEPIARLMQYRDNFGFHMGEGSSQCTCQWSPGRGVPYKGSTRCESDCDDYDYSARAADLDNDEDYC